MRRPLPPAPTLAELSARNYQLSMEILALSELIKIVRCLLDATGIVPPSVFDEMVTARAAFYRKLDPRVRSGVVMSEASLAALAIEVADAIESFGLLDAGQEVDPIFTIIKGGKDAS